MQVWLLGARPTHLACDLPSLFGKAPTFEAQSGSRDMWAVRKPIAIIIVVLFVSVSVQFAHERCPMMPVSATDAFVLSSSFRAIGLVAQMRD